MTTTGSGTPDPLTTAGLPALALEPIFTPNATGWVLQENILLGGAAANNTVPLGLSSSRGGRCRSRHDRRARICDLDDAALRTGCRRKPQRRGRTTVPATAGGGAEGGGEEPPNGGFGKAVAPANQFGIKSYNALRANSKRAGGLHAHHISSSNVSRTFSGKSMAKMIAVAVTASEHQGILRMLGGGGRFLTPPEQKGLP